MRFYNHIYDFYFISETFYNINTYFAIKNINSEAKNANF